MLRPGACVCPAAEQGNTVRASQCTKSTACTPLCFSGFKETRLFVTRKGTLSTGWWHLAAHEQEGCFGGE